MFCTETLNLGDNIDLNGFIPSELGKLEWMRKCCARLAIALFCSRTQSCVCVCTGEFDVHNTAVNGTIPNEVFQMYRLGTLTNELSADYCWLAHIFGNLCV